MNENSPLPPSGGVICPNCGAVQSTGVAYCTNCGAALPPSKSGNSLALIGKIIVGIVLFIAAIGFGGIGACLYAIGSMDNGTTSTGPNTTIEGAQTSILMGVVAGVLGVAWTVFWLVKKKK